MPIHYNLATRRPQIMLCITATNCFCTAAKYKQKIFNILHSIFLAYIYTANKFIISWFPESFYSFLTSNLNSECQLFTNDVKCST